MKIDNVMIPLGSGCEGTAYDIEYADGSGIGSLKPHPSTASATVSPSSLLLPALCHPHIHLDKAYLLTSNPIRVNNSAGSQDTDPRPLPDYSDLVPQSGTFQEALDLTSKAKLRYTHSDLLLRGAQLIAESITYGVTSMRAFVEVDHVTEFKCLNAATELKRRFAPRCHVQICAFAQDPVMSGPHGDDNRRLMEEALLRFAGQIHVLGSTPYVEESYESGLQNVKWAIATALEHNLHLDFHLDYNLDQKKKAMVFDVANLLSESKWVDKSHGKRIMLGHCTRMTLFNDEELKRLRAVSRELPVSFVGLPTSDLFMMDRPADKHNECPGDRRRGTLQILHMIQHYGFDVCMGVNNVGNAFTPWGSPDPLSLASLGVGVYQTGTVQDAASLYRCASTSARKAIGLDKHHTLERTDEVDDPEHGRLNQLPIDVLLVKNETDFTVDGIPGKIPVRQRMSIRDVVWDPPERHLRRVVSVSPEGEVFA